MLGSPLTAMIGGAAFRSVVRFEQVKAFGKHTVASLDLAYAQARAVGSARPWVAPEWAPVVLNLQGRPWWGYVHHGGVVTDRRDKTGSVVRYTLIGTSLPLNNEKTRSWKSTSPSAVSRQIGVEYNLRTLITPSRMIMPYYAQPGISDWKVLQQMSDKTGNRLWVDGSTLTFVDPKILLEGVRALSIPTFSQNRVGGRRDNMHSFVSKSGTMVPREGGATTRQVVNGLDPRTGNLVRASAATSLGDGSPIGSAPVLTKVMTAAKVGNVGQAVDAVEAGAQSTSGWITAEAVVTGSPDVVPGSLVNISGTRIPEDQTGNWLVTGVSHRVINDGSATVESFTSTLQLTRDKFYGPQFHSATRTSNTRDLVPAKMRNGFLWEAEYMENINVG